MSVLLRLLQSYSRSLRTKITLGVVIPLIIILGIFTAIEYSRHRDAVLDNLSFLASQVSQVIENSLQHEMLSKNIEGIQHMLDSIAEGESIRVVNLMDMTGKVIFAPGNEGVGTRLDNRDITCQPCHKLPAEERPSSVVVTLKDGERVFRSMNPIENRYVCQECHGSSQRLIGMLLTDISMEQIEAPLAADLRMNIFWGALTIFVTVVIVNLILNKIVIKRFQGLAHTMDHFGKGELELRMPTEYGDGDEIDRLAQAFNEMGQRIQDEAAENLALTDLLRKQSEQRGELLKRLITAQEDERKRVARELHDDLGQSLAGLALQAEATEQLITKAPDRALDQLERIKNLINDTVNRMYDLIMALRPSALDDLGLTYALRTHAKRALAGTGIEFNLDDEELNERLPAEVEIALYRIFQEALTNVIRHANAKHVNITLSRKDGTFEGQIVDDGSGFDPQSILKDDDSGSGWGLIGMQERVTQFGGLLEIDTQTGKGTIIRVKIPNLDFKGGLR